MADTKATLEKRRERLINLLRNTSEKMTGQQYQAMLDEIGKVCDEYFEAARQAIRNGEY